MLSPTSLIPLILLFFSSSVARYRKLSGGKWDKHPNMAGQYLNALVFYATLFGESPVGAAGPLDTGTAPALPLDAAILRGLQRVAESVVLDHSKHWRVQPGDSSTSAYGTY